MSTPQNYISYKSKPGNAEKLLARWMCSEAIRKGILVRQPCEGCCEPKSEAHHDDYSKPLEVRWLCKKCHGAAHRGPRRTHCVNGHPISGSNLLLETEGTLQKRRCRTCRMHRLHLRRAKLKSN